MILLLLIGEWAARHPVAALVILCAVVALLAGDGQLRPLSEWTL